MPDNDILEEQTTDTSDTNVTTRTIQIPEEFLYVYGKLLLLMIELGESMLHDCKSLCNSTNMPIVECYHMFKAALAANQLATSSTSDDSTKNYYNKVSNTLLNYVRTQLDCVTENYKDNISIVLPDDVERLVNIFIDMNNNTEIIVPSSNSNSAQAKSIIQGFVLTENSDSTYGLTEEQLASRRYWHVLNEDNEFVPNTTALYINGVRYILDDDDYEEWIITENDTSVGIGVILKTGEFDVTSPEDEIYVEAELINKD